MRLLALTPGNGRGGCEEYLLTVAAEAVAAGHAVTACVDRSRGTRSLARDLSRAGVATRAWRARFGAGDPPWPSFGVQREAALELFASNPADALLLALPWPASGTGVIAAAAEAGLPAVVVYQLAGADVDLDAAEREACVEALSAGQRWVAVSADNREHLARAFGVARDRFDLIPNGVRAPAVSEAASRAVRAELLGDASAGRQLVLTVARLDPDKGHRELLSAAIRLAGRLPGVRFAWAGEGAERAGLEAAITAAGMSKTVRLLGYREDVDELLGAADAFAFPSREEGLSFALMEAMAAGCPVVAAAASSNDELVRHERDGLLYPPGSARALADAIEWLVSHPAGAARLAASARARVRRDYSHEAMVGATLRLLGSVADGQPSRYAFKG